jgi:phosphatidylserine/phosphatidylglycerophosphate/cardiolipin synthase-like enzyme
MIETVGPVQLYSLPDESPIVHGMITQQIASATKRIRLFMYGFTDLPIADALTAAAGRSLDIAIILDHTECTTPHEAGLLSRMLRAGFPPADLCICTSPIDHQLMHKKLLICDDTVSWGSLNFSPSGFQQVNTWSVCTDPVLAGQQLTAFEDLFHWALSTQPMYQRLPA